MKYSTTAARALTLLSLWQASQSASLRSGSSCPNATTTANTRCLQDTPVPLNEDLLNQLIEFLLPSINRAIQENVPDPLVLDLSDALTLGSVDIGCDDPVTAGFTYDVGGITGLSNVSIELLEVVEGTDSIVGDCFLNQDWAATFNIAIASVSTLSVDDLGAAFRASGCGISLSPGVGGTIRTENPSLSGTVEMAGQLCAGGFLTVNTAKIIETLAVGYSNIGVELTNVPAVFSPVANQVNTPIVSAFEPLLTTVMEPEVRPIIEQALESGSTFAPFQLIPIHATLASNNLQSSFRSFFRSEGGD